VTRHSTSAPDHTRSGTPTTGAVTASAEVLVSPATTRRRWLFRFLAAVVLPGLALLLIELGLRLAGFGHPTSLWLRTTINGEPRLVENTWFGLRFFPPALARAPAPVVMRPQKPAGGFRIFLFGESAALGDPRPAYGPGRYLETLLRECVPGREFEVVCVAITAINSHALVEIARECARYEGDLWIVYAGNNEMSGPFGANSVFGLQAPPQRLVRALLLLQRLRVGQACVGLARRFGGSPASPESWGGLRMFQDHQLPPDDPRRQRVYEDFRRNLAALIQTGRKAGVPILLSTVGSNLKDCPPFGSLHAPALEGEALVAWQALQQTGDTLAQRGQWTEAAESYAEAIRRSPRFAETHFRLGQSALAMTNLALARASFERARDLDTLPFRADAQINAVIADAARAHAGAGVQWLDAVEALARESPDLIPGEESFHEHVHLNFAGNHRLARAWAGAIAAQLPGLGAGDPTRAWAAPEVCAERLGLTDWNRQAVLEEVARRLAEAPFTNQFNHAARMDRLRGKLLQLRKRVQTQDPQDARRLYEAAICSRPEDHWLHHNYAEFLTRAGEWKDATTELERVRDLTPHHYAAHLQLGRLLARQKRFDEARASLGEALRRRPDLAEAYVERGQISAGEGRFEEALAEFDAAIRRRPDDAATYLRRADVLMALKRREAAIESLRAAIRWRPSYWEAHFLLGVELASDGKVSEAAQAFAEVLRLRPEHVLARLNLGNVLARQGRFAEARPHFEEVLRRDPQNAAAREAITALGPDPPAAASP